MCQSQYSLSWEAHVRNICDGLSSLQQNGEFVDMTLAADGHIVKVHQVVLALASPYFKELITSVKCSHPVIFLNKVKHATLSAILEYIYTGEVLVSLENLNDLVEAARELHIKGLKDMRIHPSLKETAKEVPLKDDTNQNAAVLEDEELCLFQVALDEEDRPQVEVMPNIGEFTTDCNYDDESMMCERVIEQDLRNESHLDDGIDNMHDNQIIQEDAQEPENDSPLLDEDMSMMHDENTESYTFDTVSTKCSLNPGSSALQYTVSNQGSLQIILNRYMYYLKHTNRDKSRQWRCVDYLSHGPKCQAYVITKDDIVVQRIAAHTHPYHDLRILKKLKTGAIFSAIIEAEKEGIKKKNKLESPLPTLDQ